MSDLLHLERWPEGLDIPKIIVRQRRALYDLKQAPWLWHNEIYAFQISLGFTQISTDLHLYLCGDSTLPRPYVDNICKSYLQTSYHAALKVTATHSEIYSIMNLSGAHQFLCIEICHDGTRASLCYKADITSILRRFGIEHYHRTLMLMGPNV